MPTKRELPMDINLTRRKFLTLGGLGFASIALTSGSRHTNFTTDEQQLVQQKINIPDLPKVFQDYRIGFITDTHVGVSVPIDWLEQAITTLKQNKIDLLLLGGDYVWLPESLLNRMIPIVRNPNFNKLDHHQMIKTAYQLISKTLTNISIKDGIYGVLGNHDNWYSPVLCRQLLQTRNIQLLVNKKIDIARGRDKLELVGFDDYWTGRPLFPAIPFKKISNQPRIVLSHNPDLLSFLHDDTEFEFDLGLSGHTHGGQIRLPGKLGAIHYGIRDTRLADGFFCDKQTSFYTNRGLGVSGIPIRINCPAEITILTLHKA